VVERTHAWLWPPSASCMRASSAVFRPMWLYCPWPAARSACVL
jgi:hypothetical protein